MGPPLSFRAKPVVVFFFKILHLFIFERLRGGAEAEGEERSSRQPSEHRD